MDFSVSFVDVEGRPNVTSARIVSLSRRLAKTNNAVPSPQQIEHACACFASIGMTGVEVFIKAVQMLETESEVIGCIGFTFDKDGLVSQPFEEGESENDRRTKILRLPHVQWGNTKGTATALSDLVALAEAVKRKDFSSEQKEILSRIFDEAALFISRGTSAQ